MSYLHELKKEIYKFIKEEPNIIGLILLAIIFLLMIIIVNLKG